MKKSTKASENNKSWLNKANLQDIRIKLVTVSVLLVLWEGLSRLGLISSLALPRPTHLVTTVIDLVVTGYPTGVTALMHIGATVSRILQGFILAAVLAIPLGLFVGSSNKLRDAMNPVVVFSRSIATISLLPLAIAWFGVGETTRVLLICYGCFWPILTNTMQGIMHIDKNLVNAAIMLGANKRQILYRVLLPSTLPVIFSGLKIGLGIGFMVIIGVEMIGTVEGLGALIQQARLFYSTDIAVSGMFFIAVFGLGITIAIEMVERLLIPWTKDLQEVER